MNFIQTDNAPKAVGAYSQGVSTGNLVFFSGQIGLTPEGEMAGDDITRQTTQILQNISALLEATSLTKNNVVKATIFLTDIDDFAIVNGLYGDFFGDHRPARSCVAVAALPKNALIEIEIIAEKSEEI